MRLSLQEIIAYHESMPVVEGATAIGGPEKQRIESSSIGIGQTRLDQGRAKSPSLWIQEPRRRC
jgi:hypothetical protein